MTADLIDNTNDWVRLSIEIPLEARLSSWLPSVLENQLLETGKSTNARLNHKRVRVLVVGLHLLHESQVGVRPAVTNLDAGPMAGAGGVAPDYIRD